MRNFCEYAPGYWVGPGTWRSHGAEAKPHRFINQQLTKQALRRKKNRERVFLATKISEGQLNIIFLSPLHNAHDILCSPTHLHHNFHSKKNIRSLKSNKDVHANHPLEKIQLL